MMPIVKRPEPLPSTLDYVPPEGMPYKVANQDSWVTLADRQVVRDAGMSARDLCFFNFRTRHPSEINWYLYNKVGCRITTHDGNNYCFSGADKPGIVYLPPVGPKPPVTDLPPRKSQPRMDAWIGIVGKAGTMFVVAGIETVLGYVVSLDDLGKGMGVGASVNRLGAGFGVTGGFSFVYITGVQSPKDLMNYQQMDKDFNIALEENWSKLAGASKAKKLQPLIKVLTSIGAKTPAGLKKALAANPDRWVDLVKAARSVQEYREHEEGPHVMMFDVPFAGKGVEVSFFYGLATWNATWDNSD
jgi:hypothetical protein